MHLVTGDWEQVHVEQMSYFVGRCLPTLEQCVALKSENIGKFNKQELHVQL